MSDVTEIPGTDHAIVMTDLFDHEVKGVEANLLRVARDGEVIWRASPPGPGPDCWSEYEVVGDVVEAFSWTCFRVRLDIATGAELSRTFTK